VATVDFSPAGIEKERMNGYRKLDVVAYLKRIQYGGSLEPAATTLRALQIAHMRTIPFENLDIHLQRPITLQLEDLFDKIVLRRRGGFCYELNGLFASLLENMGFLVELLSARDAHADGSYGPEFDHLALHVRCPRDASRSWLVDVGWGDTFQEPLHLDYREEQVQGLRGYRIDLQEGYYLLWQHNYDGTWEKHYRFSLHPRRLPEFEPMCRYHQTSAESPFTQNRICTLATEDGRISLDGWRWISTVHGERRERAVRDEAEYLHILKEKFGVIITEWG
jgi:N-hydroxyarylamine O-acetyltransferase